MTRNKLDPSDVPAARRHFQQLGQYAPGQSGNPRGRPPAPDTDDLIEILKWRLGRSGARKLADRLIELALDEKGGAVTLNAIQYIYDRIEGKPRQAALSSGDEEPEIVRILRQLTDSTKALEGRELPSIGSGYSVSTVDAEEVRVVASPDSGSAV